MRKIGFYPELRQSASAAILRILGERKDPVAEPVKPAFTIETDIPVPKVSKGRYPNPILDTARKLEVGESFLVPLEGDNPYVVRRKVQTSLAAENQRNKSAHYTTRSVSEKLVRIWRDK